MQEQSRGHYHLQMKFLTSLSAQNLFADFAKYDKKSRPVHLVHYFFGALVYRFTWCTGSLVHWCTGSPGALVHWFTWCTGSLGSPGACFLGCWNCAHGVYMAIMIWLTFYLYGLINKLTRPTEMLVIFGRFFGSFCFSAHKIVVNQYCSFKVQVQCTICWGR